MVATQKKVGNESLQVRQETLTDQLEGTFGYPLALILPALTTGIVGETRLLPRGSFKLNSVMFANTWELHQIK